MKQGQYICLGIIGCVVVIMLPMEWLVRNANYFLVLIGLSLLYLFMGVIVKHLWGGDAISSLPFFAGEIKGAFRWLKLGPVNVQPSEFAKFGLLLFVSAYYGTRRKEELDTFVKGCLVPGVCAGVIVLLILLGKDLSSAMVTGAMVGGIMWCGGVRFRHLLLCFLIASLAAALMVASSPNRRRRIKTFLHLQQGGNVEVRPGTASEEWIAAQKKAASDNSYQLNLSLMALGSGGMSGRGFTYGLMKKGYLPERHTDFILSVWGEEMGFGGMLFVLFCYFTMMISLVGIGCMCRERVGMLICLGFSVLVTLQSITNIGVVSGWGPTTGVTAPFVSYGGSSVMSLLLCVGLVGNVCRRTYRAMMAEQERGSNFPSMAALATVRIGELEDKGREQETD